MDPLRAGYQPVPDEAPHRAGRSWWDANADDYLAEHGEFLGDDDFCWCPEGLREEEAHLLGEVAGAQVLELGAGAGQCSRWLANRGASVIATDISARMLTARDTTLGQKRDLSRVQADARRLPFAGASFDVVFTAYGAIPFVADAESIHREVARVLRPSGRWVFAVTHPIRWAFPDDPSEHGLTAVRSYFDRTPYAERDAAGRLVYAEFHRTVGDHVREVVASGLTLLDIVEPEWPDGHGRTWGGWSPLRGRTIPGTAIFVAELRAPGAHP